MPLQPSSASADEQQLPPVDIKPLLKSLWPLQPESATTADAIAEAISYFFTNQVSDVQASALLMCMHFTGWDRRPEVLSSTAAAMLRAATPIPDPAGLRAVVARRGRREGAYAGGLCDVVGTGGDSHDTFNISTTASILASSLLLVAKHGNKASTSKSGSADLLAAMRRPVSRAPDVPRGVRADTLARVWAESNYAFLYAPTFHPGMRFVAPIRRQLPWRTVFNLVGPLANPVDVLARGRGEQEEERATGEESLIEARLLGVARKDLGPVFASALSMVGATKAMVVCGDEELDEISCAGPTLCWMLKPSQSTTSPSSSSSPPAPEVEHFLLHPSDFGLPTHPLSEVGSGKGPEANAATLARILAGELADDDPLLHFVLINTAALFVVSGVCEADASDMGHGDDGRVVAERGPGGGRWKEGVRRARWAIRSGEAARQWARFVEVTNRLAE